MASLLVVPLAASPATRSSSIDMMLFTRHVTAASMLLLSWREEEGERTFKVKNPQLKITKLYINNVQKLKKVKGGPDNETDKCEDDK